ncbi:MAG: ABC transporter permease subunit [Chloroflexi bacterium]|nr:ABC transporter permease subunit [Chloroflexota bacterium]
MTADSGVDRSALIAARQGLVPVKRNGRFDGFENILRKELGDWFGTRRWIVQTILWLVIINGLMAFILFAVPSIDPSEQVSAEENLAIALDLYFNFAILFGSIGMIILTQDEIIQEKQSGTAAWLLSKPVSRSAFILAKLLSGLVGGLVFIAGLTAAAAYVETYLVSHQTVQLSSYLMGTGVVLLALVFYLTMVIMLGAIFEQRGALLGIAVGVLLGGLIASQFTPLVSYFLPVNMADIALAVVQKQPLPLAAVSQLVATGGWSLLFTSVALWVFGREEF